MDRFESFLHSRLPPRKKSARLSQIDSELERNLVQATAVTRGYRKFGISAKDVARRRFSKIPAAFFWEERTESAQSDRYIPFIRSQISNAVPDHTFRVNKCQQNTHDISAEWLPADLKGCADAIVIDVGAEDSSLDVIRLCTRVAFELKKEGVKEAAH
eukprot:Opistho-2@23733